MELTKNKKFEKYVTPKLEARISFKQMIHTCFQCKNNVEQINNMPEKYKALGYKMSLKRFFLLAFRPLSRKLWRSKNIDGNGNEILEAMKYIYDYRLRFIPATR